MPTYVYKCAKCGHMFEARQRMSDSPLTDCPNCEESALRRVINSVGIVFKGSGFYVTDNRNGKSSANGTVSGSDSAAKDGDTKAETSKDSKPSTETTDKKADKPPKNE